MKAILFLLCAASASILKTKPLRLQSAPSRQLMFEQMNTYPKYNQFYSPGLKVNPQAYQSPMYPFVGQSSMLPAPPAIFHDGALPIMSIYELHHPDAYTPTSPYGLPYVYNPYHALNMPYNYLHHPYATQLMTSLGANQMAQEPYTGAAKSYVNSIQIDVSDKENPQTITNSGRK